MAQCANCSFSLAATDEFCGNCGTRVRVASRTTYSVETEPPPTDGTEPPPAAGPRVSPTLNTEAPAGGGFSSVTMNGPRTAGPPPADASREPVSLPGPTGDSWETGLAVSYTNASDEPSFDPLHNRRFGWQLFRRFLLWQSVPWVIGILTGIIAGVAGSVGVLAIIPIVWIICVLLFLFLPVPGLLAQWSRLVPFGAPAQVLAFDHIKQAMAAHNTPNDVIDTPQKLIPGEGVQQYLRLKRWIFSGFISCFTHGQDLYVGWTFWIYTSPFQVGLMWLGRKFQDRTGRGNEMYQTLRYDSTRATIAALHACTLEGVRSAVRAVSPTPTGTQ